MAWKKVWATEYDVHQSDIDGSAIPLAAMDVLGKRIRVTVEEEVGECCEKWRGRTAETNWVNGCNYVTYRVKPAFCPECGRRL